MSLCNNLKRRREKNREREDVGEYIFIVGTLMRGGGGGGATRKGNCQPKEGH